MPKIELAIFPTITSYPSEVDVLLIFLKIVAGGYVLWAFLPPEFSRSHSQADINTIAVVTY